MAYNELLADRIREAFAHLTDIEERKMFGGLCFLVHEKMCLGIVGDDLMCRIAPEIYEAALERHGCREMDFTHRPMKGYVFVDPTGYESPADFKYWINLALDFNARAKSSKKKK